MPSDDGLSAQLGGDPPRTVATRVSPKDLVRIENSILVMKSPFSDDAAPISSSN